ncbi:MAG: PHP domain-containing protein [Chloroflexi bacterium]|nr:MAG: PHP domain-containing protein [Chloroflexota bacterium]
MARYFADLHVHSRASFDALASPRDIVRVAAERGLTHIAITDHDRIDGALAAREAAPRGLSVIIGEEVRTDGGDLICLFLERAIAPGLSADETIEEARSQGGMVGIPHPFDRFRGSMLRTDRGVEVAGRVDWVEAYNARAVGGAANERAAEFAREHGLPGIAVSDAHSLVEVGVAYTAFESDVSGPAGLREALGTLEIVPGRASYVIRALTPVAKLIQRMRGNQRVKGTSGR